MFEEWMQNIINRWMVKIIFYVGYQKSLPSHCLISWGEFDNRKIPFYFGIDELF